MCMWIPHTTRSSSCNDCGVCGELGVFLGDLEGDLLLQARSRMFSDFFPVLSGDADESRGARADRARSGDRCSGAV